MDEECHIEGREEFESACAECCDARNRYCNRSGYSAHQRVFGSSLRLPGSLLSDDPIDRQLLAADPYTEFAKSNAMRSAAQQALFKQNTTRAVQTARLARSRTQPKDSLLVGDTVMVWRHNKTTGKRGWTGPGVIIAISQTKTSFWIHMRGALLKCSGEQVRKATDAEYLGTELVKVLSQELLKSRERSGQRGYVDVEVEGNPDEEPPEDTRPDVRDVVGIPSSSDISGDLRGHSRMTPIPEDRGLRQDPPPTQHQPSPPAIDNDGDSVMETQPEIEPSAAASSRTS